MTIASSSVALRAVSRRAVLAATLGLAAAPAAARAQTSPPPREERDAWFWRAVKEIEAGPPAGGPSSGEIDHSIFGVDAHRAGRTNPSGTPPALDEFYLKAVLDVDTSERTDWDVGFVWRLSWEMDALWWAVSNDGQWTLSSAIWAYSPRDAEELRAGKLCFEVESPVTLQVLAAGAHLAVSVNEGPVIVTTIPEDREPGQIGILANAREENLRPTGFTPYRHLAVWKIASADLPDDVWEEWEDPC